MDLTRGIIGMPFAVPNLAVGRYSLSLPACTSGNAVFQVCVTFLLVLTRLFFVLAEARA